MVIFALETANFYLFRIEKFWTVPTNNFSHFRETILGVNKFLEKNKVYFKFSKIHNE
jgi:hypothetical protein